MPRLDLSDVAIQPIRRYDRNGNGDDRSETNAYCRCGQQPRDDPDEPQHHPDRRPSRQTGTRAVGGALPRDEYPICVSADVRAQGSEGGLEQCRLARARSVFERQLDYFEREIARRGDFRFQSLQTCGYRLQGHFSHIRLRHA